MNNELINNENLSPQIPKTLFENIKKAVPTAINLDEFQTRLKTVDQNAYIRIDKRKDRILVRIKNFKNRRYVIEHQLVNTSVDNYMYFSIAVFDAEPETGPVDIYYNKYADLSNKDGVFKAKKVNTKPFVEQYNSFRQEYFNMVSAILLKTVNQFKEDGVEPVVISTIQDISQLIQKNTFVHPTTHKPPEDRSLNSAFKRLYDKL